MKFARDIRPGPPVQPAAWFERRLWRGGRSAPGTKGASQGTSGDRDGATLLAWLIIAALMALIDTINIFTVLSDASRYGAAIASWEPVCWELTSGLSELAVCGIVLAAIRRAPPGITPLSRLIVAHFVASIVFSLAHVALMTIARVAVYDLAGRQYSLASVSPLYEYRKDVLSYLLIGAIFWWFTPERGAEPRGEPDSLPQTGFDIIDGSNFIRVSLVDILAVRAAGNYVEFILADGRRPLMRASLVAIEKDLSARGFVRTHRSWLVNRDHISGATATGSGDFSLELRRGVRAPLSRRYRSSRPGLKETESGGV